MHQSPENEYLSEIREWLNSVSFKKRRFGGVDEADVWKKIGKLNALYEKLLIAERAARQKEDVSDE